MDILADTVSCTPKGFDVLIDGGIRRGSDIAKAVALGAKGVLLGRAPLYGLAGAGLSGVNDVLSMLRNELEICLRLLGCPDIGSLDASYLVGEREPRIGAAHREDAETMEIRL